MAEYLYAAFEVPQVTPPDTGQKAGRYFPSALFDFESGDFVRDGANRIVRCDGKTAWEQWCVKTVCTQRYACLSYDPDAGIEGEEILSEHDRAAAESRAERSITEALMADPLGRTRLVKDFVFVWGEDSVEITFTAEGIDGEPSRLTALLKGGVSS